MARREQTLKYLTPSIPADELDLFKRSFCIPNDPKWLGNFMGAILPLTDAANWELDGVVTPEEAATVFQTIFSDAFYATGECDDMTCCPLRYGADGVLQQQNPITGEWENIENPPLPARTPVTGQDTVCLAAANATNVIAQMWAEVDRQFFTGATPYIALAALISLLAVLIFYPPAFFAVLTFFIEFYGIWSEISGDDFDSDQQEQLTKILFCNGTLNGDGTVTFDFTAVLAEVDELWEAVVDFNIFTMVSYMLGIIGEEGLNRAGATTGIVEYDCSGFDCTCHEPIWTFPAMCADWDMSQDFGATCDAGGMYGTFNFFGAWGMSAITALVVPVGCTITGFNVTLTGSQGSDPNNHSEAWLDVNRTAGLSNPQWEYGTTWAIGLNSFTKSIVGSGQTIYFAVGWIAQAGASIRLTRAEVTYTGVKPSFTGGTPC